jgi:hypothetical protein
LIVIAIRISPKRGLIAYCILFFFLNHLIEGIDHSSGTHI